MTNFGTNPVTPTTTQCCSGLSCPEPDKHWIEIDLKYEDDSSPVDGEEYCITLPDGAEVRGHLDKKGFARVDGIENPGTCQITFPKLDRRIWKPV